MFAARRTSRTNLQHAVKRMRQLSIRSRGLGTGQQGRSAGLGELPANRGDCPRQTRGPRGGAVVAPRVPSLGPLPAKVDVYKAKHVVSVNTHHFVRHVGEALPAVTPEGAVAGSATRGGAVVAPRVPSLGPLPAKVAVSAT